jgi:Flp pilus assembly pilin Flp
VKRIKEKFMKSFLVKFLRDERGLAAVEYAVVAGLVTVGLIAVFTTIGTEAAARLETLANAL